MSRRRAGCAGGIGRLGTGTGSGEVGLAERRLQRDGSVALREDVRNDVLHAFRIGVEERVEEDSEGSVREQQP